MFLRRLSLGACSLLAGFAVLGSSTGCLSGDEIEDIVDELDLDDIEFEINESVNVIQTVDPRVAVLPVALVEPVVIADEVVIVTDVSEDLFVETLPDITLLGFENITGLDAYYRYLVDGELQGVFVFDGETLLLEYPCLFDVELLSEDYFDPFTGELVEAFDLEGAFFEEGFDFFCGEAVFFTFDIDGITVDFQTIDLVP